MMTKKDGGSEDIEHATTLFAAAELAASVSQADTRCTTRRRSSMLISKRYVTARRRGLFVTPTTTPILAKFHPNTPR